MISSEHLKYSAMHKDTFFFFLFFFFAKNETISYNKMQQVTHIDNKVKRLQNIQARAGS